MARPIHEIAAEIRQTWKKVNFAARPYLEAMFSLNTINDNYLCESGRSVVSHFLSNASTWRGEDARRIKAELRSLLK